MNSLEIADKKQQLKDEAIHLCNICKTEIRNFNEDEEKRIAEIKNELEDLNKELRTLDNSIEIQNNKQIKINKQMKEFRLIKAINDIANNRNLDDAANAIVNEGAKEMRKAGLSFGGQIQLPTEERAAITVQSEGEDVVETNFTSILEPLRAKNVLLQAGAKFLGGLVGDVQVPAMGATNVTWEGEVDAAKDGAGTFTNVKLQPKRLTAYVDVSKQFLVQDSLDAESMLKNDIINAINSKLESTILGSVEGTATQPQGIFYSADEIATVSNFGDLTNIESDVEDANVMGECKYIVSNKAKAKLRNMSKSAKSTELVMEHGEIDGTPVLNTSNVGGTNIAYGDFSNLCIGQWGAIDLTVDPFSQATNGKVRLVVNAFFDAKVLRPNAIAVAKV